MTTVTIYNEIGRKIDEIDNVILAMSAKSLNTFFIIATDPYNDTNYTIHTAPIDSGYRIEFLED